MDTVWGLYKHSCSQQNISLHQLDRVQLGHGKLKRALMIAFDMLELDLMIVKVPEAVDYDDQNACLYSLLL